MADPAASEPRITAPVSRDLRSANHRGIGSAYFYVRDVDRLYAELLEKGADVRGEPVSQPWGLREFSVLDAERNRLTFGQTFE